MQVCGFVPHVKGAIKGHNNGTAVCGCHILRHAAKWRVVAIVEPSHIVGELAAQFKHATIHGHCTAAVARCAIEEKVTLNGGQLGADSHKYGAASNRTVGVEA